METPICVTDAKTLVDQIQNIKRWIYHGQLRLVIPMTTYEKVEQIYQKSKEVKPTTKEAPRPKVVGKPAKKEHPTFDINPFLAKNFLSRLKTWKEESAASEQRDFYQEKENHESVSFQQPSEQYAPWKDVEEEEEKPEVTESRPTTWAEALRKKQSIANGIAETTQAQKGPAKPKLVARSAGSESSPWKIKRDAPKISPKDVPANLRPLMSCALWRLHESIDRNDANELFLLSDQAELRTVAKKLNVIVRSAKDLNDQIAAKDKRSDLDAYGDVEREFGVEQKVHKKPSSEPTLDKVIDELPEQPLNAKQSQRSVDKGPNGTAEGSQSRNQIVINGEKVATTETENEITHVLNGQEDPQPTHVMEDSMINSNGNDDSSNGDNTAMDGMKVGPLDSQHSGALPAPNSAILRSPENQIATKQVSNPESSTDASGQGDEAKISTFTTHSNAAGPTPAHKGDVLEPPKIPEVANEPEDSDEEVVVFVPQPKRFSNQKKPVPQSSRPVTPNTQDIKKAPKQSPKTPSSAAPAQRQPQPPSRGRNANVTSHGHPQPKVQPTVIDPDAFGRSFAVNPDSGTRTLHNPRSHHHPKRSVENTGPSQSSRGKHHSDLRAKSPRQEPQHPSPRRSPAPESNGPREQNMQVETPRRTSPQGSIRLLEPKDATPRGRGPIHANDVVQTAQKSLNARMIESEEFVPRSAFSASPSSAALGAVNGQQPKYPSPQMTRPAAKIQPTMSGLQTMDPNSFGSRSPQPGVQVQPATSDNRINDVGNHQPRHSQQVPLDRPEVREPQAAETNGFVPRSPRPTMQYRQPKVEPEAIEPGNSMPEVHYVLKSGSTRAATRGRGKLWTPS